MKNAIHIIYCVCAALVAAEPGLESSMPSAAPYLKAGLAVCAAVLMALRFIDPADASTTVANVAPSLPPMKPAPSVEQSVAQATAANAAALQASAQPAAPAAGAK